MHARIADPATTLVWIDTEEAIIIRWDDRATVERVRSDVPGRRRSAGRDRIGSGVRGGGGGPEAAERNRRAHLATFLDEVAGHVPVDDDVLVVGPGAVRERLERSLRADDRRLGHHRLVHTAASERMSEAELVARVRELAGDAPRRVGLPV
jgi:hypothetical protein